MNSSVNELDDFRKEIELMKTIGYHANIVNILASCTKFQPLLLVVEFMNGGDLLGYLKEIRKMVRTSHFSVWILATGTRNFVSVVDK